MSLWRVSFMFQGKDMEKIMTAISKHRVVNLEGPMPAIEMDERPMMDVLTDELIGRKEVTTQDIHNIVEEAGRSGKAYTYYVKQLAEKGIIRSKSRGVYTVTRPQVSKTKKATKTKGGE